jgi:RNA polymerase sigma-70 factor (ECF subfamily)
MHDRISEDQLRRIYRETIDTLYAYVSRRCGGVRELAEDVTQEAWLRAVRDWRRNGPPENPNGWLTTVARNLLINQQRRKEGVPLEEVSSAEVLASIDQNTVSDSAEVASLVNAALARMPREEARLLESFHYDRHKTAQLAEAYGTSERAIEGRLRRARERLRRELESTMKSLRGLA